jgi:hypothetical protein
MARLNRVSLAVAALFLINAVACRDEQPQVASERPMQLAAAPHAEDGHKPKKKKEKKKGSSKKAKSASGMPPAGFLQIDACGARLRPTDKLFVASDEKGEEPRQKLELAEDTQAVRDALAADPKAGARPGVITVSVYTPEAGEKLKHGVQKRYAADPKAVIRRTELAGTRAFFTQTTGKSGKLDVVTFGCDGAVVEITVPVSKPNAELRKEFARLLSSLKFGPKPPQQFNGGCKAPSDGCESPMLSVCKDGQWTCAAVEAAPAAEKAAQGKPATDKPKAAADKPAPGKSAAAPGKAKAEKPAP